MRKIGEINGLRDLRGHSLSGGSTPVPSTDPDAAIWFAAASPPISDPTEKAAVNQFALDLKGTGSTPNNSDVWSSLHWINLVSATSLAASLNDLKGGYNLTAYNSPTWSPNGIMGNGINQYLQQDYIASTDGSILNSNSFGIAVRTPQNIDASLMGARFGTTPYTVFNYYSGLRYVGNNSTFATFSDPNYPNGVIISNRVSGTDFKIWINNLSIYNVVTPTNSLAPVPMNILSQNYQGSALVFSDMEFTVAFEGEGLTANQIEDLNASINTLNLNIIAGGR